MCDNSGSHSPHGAENYSVPKEATKVFQEGILENPLISSVLPKHVEIHPEKIKFVGSDFPSIPINWRFAESISALKGLEGVLLNALLEKKYGCVPQEIIVDTDHAQLFFMSSMTWELAVGNNKPLSVASFRDEVEKAELNKLFKNYDFDIVQSGLYRQQATNIYKTKDNRFFHLHGSLNSTPTLEALGLPQQKQVANLEEAVAPFIAAVGKLESAELQELITNKYKQAGTICWTKEEYLTSEHGKANAGVGLFEIYSRPHSNQVPCWWPSTSQTGPARPLAGLKVVDLTRIIAAPALTRGLAEMGASVMRITAPHIPDLSQVHPDLNWGKWCASLDLRKEKDRGALRALILDADVVVSAYRPGVLDKYGFGTDDVLEMCKGRDRGVIVCRVNSYGWHGPWSARSGWQQISDANCGVSMEFGRSMGLEEPVTPVFPNADYCTGEAGVSGVLSAIMRRGQEGGSYQVDVALNYYSQWLVNSVGVYPPMVWDKLWTNHGRLVFRHYHNMHYALGAYFKMLYQNSAAQLFKPSFFETRAAKALHDDASYKTPKPILTFPEGKVTLGFNISTRGNDVDQPRWPEDLMAEIVV